jgi:hypothetical protein
LIAAGALGVLVACSGITENRDGISTLEVIYPANTFLELGDSVTLRAVARNAAGDSIGVPIRWYTPDSTITLDSVRGVATGLTSSGVARIVASVIGKDTLLTQLGGLSLTLTAKADTLALVGDDSLEVPHDTSTAELQVELLGGSPLVGVFGRPITLRIVDPAPVDSPTVAFLSGQIVDSILTDGTGSILSRVHAVANRTPPDRVVISINAYRASGTPIPGSGHQVVLRFRHQ